MDGERDIQGWAGDADEGLFWFAPGSEAEWRHFNTIRVELFDLRDVLRPFDYKGYDFDSDQPERYPHWLLAQGYLFVALNEFGPSPARDLTELALRIGLNESSLRAARKKLRVLAEKRGGVRHGGWWWRLPPQLKTFDALIDFDMRWGWWLQFR